MRLRLRDLMILLDKKRRKIVYTDFNDEIMNLRDGEAIYIPRMTGAQYAKKVKDYLRTHTNDFVIHRLRTNQPLTELDLQGLECTLKQIRLVELVIDQLTYRGMMDASALYEPPFSNIHIGGPEGLFAGRERVMDNIFEQLKAVNGSAADVTR
ncbi:MAG: hypothetical protein WC340_16340 [Kiritimatiellia bacterium]